ncbi:MAG TPA: hypothetical protein VFV38_14600 [Ktedonobacteraceae bacterium]|nr:hypothetical protein [Ktedonobacteraceae bacterium]
MFFGGHHLSERLLLTIGLKERVPAKAVSATRGDDGSRNDSFKKGDVTVLTCEANERSRRRPCAEQFGKVIHPFQADRFEEPFDQRSRQPVHTVERE